MSTERRIEELKAFILGEHERLLEHQLAQVAESPIEKLMLLALIAHGWVVVPDLGRHNEAADAVRRAFGLSLREAPLRQTYFTRYDSDHVLAPQFVVSRGGRSMRLDLAFIALPDADAGPKRIAVELDGHDFHERTKEQASRDKARDRLLTVGGWSVLRYTGSDVYARAEQIADELFWICAGVDPTND